MTARIKSVTIWDTGKADKEVRHGLAFEYEEIFGMEKEADDGCARKKSPEARKTKDHLEAR